MGLKRMSKIESPPEYDSIEEKTTPPPALPPPIPLAGADGPPIQPVTRIVL